MSTLLLIAALGAYLTYAWVAGRPGEPHYHFRERKTIDVLSAICLSITAAYYFALWTVERTGQDREKGEGALIPFALGWLFLAFDELRKFHEKFGHWIKDWLGNSSAFRNWNDVLVTFYCVIGIAFVLWLLPVLLRYKYVLELILIGFLWLGIHTTIDNLIQPTYFSRMVEESAKLIGVAFVTLSSYHALMGSIAANRLRGAQDNDAGE